ncbi:hypothetical protein [Actinosynnema sp. NPDC020468]|uniref:hypothetical protein n=1 Tax=Actinosynnema sp. NPDC020468 TaxID=3154488 RepID=UPI0033ED3E2B
MSVDYTRTGPVSWHVNSARVDNNCAPFYGHFQLASPYFNYSNGDSPSSTGFTVPINQDWGGTGLYVCGTGWFKVTPTFWAENGYACVGFS